MIVPLGKLLLGSGSFGSSGTTGGAGELYGADYGFLGSNHFEAFEVEVANLKRLAETEVVDVDHQTLGDIGVDGLDFDFLHGQGEFTTGFHTFGVAFEFNRHRHNDGLVLLNLEEVDVEDIVFYRVELHLAEHCVLLLSVDVEFDGEDVGSVDELADSIVGNGNVGGDYATAIFDFDEFLAIFESAFVGKFNNFTTVDDGGDETFCAECGGSFLAEINAGGGFQFVSFHELKNECVTKN